jgi:hypothetical protein
LVNGTEKAASIYVPRTFLATGITVLNGSAPDTSSKRTVALRSKTGRHLANSAAAGAVITTADIFQAQDFTAVFLVTGPALYWLGANGDSSDAGAVRSITSSTFNNVMAEDEAQTFGSFANFTTVATFTSTEGPIACLY